MTTVTVYDPAMCCSTGICGAEVDQNLVNFAADLDWLKGEGVTVTRINLSQEPAAFVANEKVNAILQNSGVDGLPVVMLGDQMHSSGRYPAREELAKMADVAYSSNARETENPTEDPGCGCGDSKAEESTSGCC